MAKVFLDANVFIDIIEKRSTVSIEKFQNHTLFISPLAIHIFAYVYRYQIPSNKLVGLERYYNIVPADLTVTLNSLLGPTQDFEDNVQLHSCAESECDYFLTGDEGLLRMKFFGKTQITSPDQLEAA